MVLERPDRLQTWRLIATRRLLLAICIILGGCDIISPRVGCPELRSALVLDVVDSLTNAPAAEGAQGQVQISGYVAILLTVSPGVMQLSPELGDPGVYEVTISKAGYQTWRKTDVRVEEGRCGPETTRLTARLQRT